MSWKNLALASLSAGLFLTPGFREVRAQPATEFFPLVPCRVVDTRLPDGPLTGPALVANADRTFLLHGSCGIPAQATAVSVNLAVVGGTVAGNLRLHPGGTVIPLVSSINYAAGQIRSNNAVASLSATGEIEAYVGAAFGTVHFILDVNGYFAPAPPSLSGFSPGLSWVNVGQTSVPTFPIPLTVTLGWAAVADTFVTVASSDSGAVVVTGGGVLIPTGQSSSQVLVTGVGAGTATLTATLGLTSLNADVRALDGSEVPALVSLLPQTATVSGNGTQTLTVGLDLPAPAGGTEVTLGLVPSNAGALPPTVTVPEGQISLTFDYVDGGIASEAIVTATLGATTLSSTLTMSPLHLVINEVDYDQPGTDSTEYVEIHNPTAAPISLANHALVFVNGGVAPATEYRRVLLDPAGTIPAGGYLVIASAAVTVVLPGVRYTPPGWPASDAVQNGAADGMLLVNTATLAVIDRLSYEGSVTVTLPGFGTISLVEGSPATAADPVGSIGSIARIPNGIDNDNAATDWVFTIALTPGAANVLASPAPGAQDGSSRGGARKR